MNKKVIVAIAACLVFLATALFLFTSPPAGAPNHPSFRLAPLIPLLLVIVSVWVAVRSRRRASQANKN